MKKVLLTWYLRLLALITMFFWGGSHLFFPVWYLENIAHKPASFLTPQNILLVNEIGGLALAMGIVMWIAAKQPVKNFAVIVMFYLAGLSSLSVTLYHILVRQASQEWSHVIMLVVLLAILTLLYPWGELKRGATS
jgi:hypothetical protein